MFRKRVCSAHTYTTSLNRPEYLSMATVVPFASCYAQNTVSDQPLLYGKGPVRDYVFTMGPRGAPRPHLAYGPKMTIRQICRMLRMMRREATNARKVSPLPATSSPNTKPERRCFPCFRRRRSKRFF